MPRLEPGTPVDYGLPVNHTEWRRNQWESVSFCLEENDPVKIMCCPTGSGKSGIARAIASQHPTITLVRSKSLQSTIYDHIYGFDAIYGRASYSCPHPYSEEGDTAATCLYESEGMSKCPEARICPYLQAKEQVKKSSKVSANYSFWLTANWIRQGLATHLVTDECHCLPEVVLNWVGCTITAKDVTEWYMSSPPDINFNEGLSLFGGPDPCQVAATWLHESIQAVRKQINFLRRHLNSQYNGPKVKRRLARGQNILRNLQSVLSAIKSSPHEWFITSDRHCFTARPLTSRYHFPDLFLSCPTTILMSGTVGDFDTFATELGIKDYATRRVESNFAPEVRPVQVLDVPSLNYKSTEKDYDHQADVIAKAILSCPLEWSGVCHVTRKEKAPLLAERLAHRGLQDRVWSVPDLSTDKQMAAWAEHKAKSNGYGGQIALAYSWVEGVDLTTERINICAKIGWPDLSQPYEKARMNYSRSFYQLRAAWSVQQALGRTRRGEDSDYDLNGKQEQLVAIADGSWQRLRRYFDADFLASIVET